jgi:Holliday junction resolvase RusA-like endonuclease
MRVLAECWMPGRPRTKGSLNDHGNGGMSDSPVSARWRAHMVASVRAALDAGSGYQAPLSALPVRVEALCFMPETAAEYFEEEAGAMVFRAPAASSTKRTSGNGDVDKLARNLLDALARDLHDDKRKGADLFTDDMRVVDMPIRKVIEGPLGPGILVRVTELDAIELARMQSLALATLQIVAGGSVWGTRYLG